MTDPLQNRTYLHDRHRLSHQQIDRWLGEESGQAFLPEKLKQLQTVRNFLNVTDLLMQDGISFVPLKGPLLSYRIYGDPTVRISHDIDLLVDVEMVKPVMEILYENGYRLSDGVIWPKIKVQQEMVFDSSHHLSFCNEELNLCVEIHWVLLPGLPFSLKKQSVIITGNLMEEVFAGRKFSVFTKEFELLYLLIHGTVHGWNRLKWLVDINDYPVIDVNLMTFSELVKQLHADRIICLVNFLLRRFSCKQLPFEESHYLPRYSIRYTLKIIEQDIKPEQTVWDVIRLYWYQIVIFPGFCYKYRIITGIFFRSYDFQKLDSSFKIVYYLYRPYSLIKRRILHA
jgi:hypothetical protein